MEKRQQPRHQRGIHCEIRTPATRATGLVENVSAHGLFIKTAAQLRPLGLIEVVINDCGFEGGLRFEAGVARSHVGSRRFEAMSANGVGLQVIPPWDTFERWVHRPALPPLEASQSVASAIEINRPVSTRQWRVQLILRDRTRGRVMTIECDTAEQAKTLARRAAGAAWAIRSVREA